MPNLVFSLHQARDFKVTKTRNRKNLLSSLSYSRKKMCFCEFQPLGFLKDFSRGFFPRDRNFFLGISRRKATSDLKPSNLIK